MVIVDRTTPFKPAVRLNSNGWQILEQDERSTDLTEINLSRIVLVSPAAKRGEEIDGREQIRRLRAFGLVQLDAQFACAFLEKPALIPTSWQISKNNHDIPFICFDGTVLRDRKNNEYTICICLCRHSSHPSEEWLPVLYNLKHIRHPNKLSAVLVL